MVIHPRLERGTPWLKVKCSTDWASGSIGRGSRIRTYEWRSQSPLPYRLAIPLLAPEAGFEPATSWLTVTRSTGWAIQESIAISFRIVTIMERKTGLEPATPTLARLCSTTELLPHVLATILLYHRLLICQVLFENLFFIQCLTPQRHVLYFITLWYVCQQEIFHSLSSFSLFTSFIGRE